MRNIVASTLMLVGLAATPQASVNATGLGPLASVGQGAATAVIKVHGRQEVHDMLHGYGFDHVVYKSRYYDDEDKPVYRFRACEGRRAYLVDVNWYGDVLDKHRAGRCHRYDW